MQNNLLMYVYSVARKYILKHRPSVLVFLVSNFITAFTTTLLPYLFGYYIDYVVSSKNINYLYVSIVVIIASVFLGQISSVVSGISSTRLHGNAYILFNLDILTHVQNLPLSFFCDKDSAYITKRINDDTEEVISFILDNSVNLIIDTMVILSIVAILFLKFHIVLPVTFLIAVALDIVLYIYFKMFIYDISYVKKELQNDYFASINESILKIKFIKSLVINDLVNDSLLKKFQILLKTFIKFTKINYLYVSLSKFIRRISIVFVLFLCSKSIFSGEITAGDFVLSVTYFVFGFNCLDNFPEIAKKWQNVLVSIERIKTILNHKVEHNGEIALSSIHSISLNNVTFLGNQEFLVLKNFTYSFDIGFVYAITGNNGVGKSTLLNIIIGLFPVDSGEVLFNNLPSKKINTVNMRAKHVSYCDQSDYFLNMTIKQNMIFDNKNYDKNYLNALIEQFDLKDRLSSESLIKDQSIDMKLLSGGERRKISIIRTLIKDSNVYIFDEPTNALDYNGIKTFRNIINNLKVNKIVIIVTHDKSMIEGADYVLKL